MKQEIRVAVIDDHPLFREGVTRSLTEIGGFRFVGEGASAQDAHRIATTMQPDIVLLDISIPGGGLNAIKEILIDHSAQKIVVLTISESVADITEAINAGVSGYVLKGIGSSNLAEILRKVAGGEKYVSAAVLGRLLSDSSHLRHKSIDSDPINLLTDREIDILQLVAAGMSNREVADKISLQTKTIKNYMTRILAKLKARNRTEAAIFMRDRTKRGN